MVSVSARCINPSPTASSEIVTRSSRCSLSLRARIALVSALWSEASATAPPQSELSTAISPPARTSRRQRS